MKQGVEEKPTRRAAEGPWGFGANWHTLTKFTALSNAILLSVRYKLNGNNN